MGSRAIVVELPEDLVATLGSAEAAATEARRALVLALLRDGRLSQGRAAEILGITRAAMLDLAAEYRIPSGAETPEELRDEIASLREFVQHSRSVDSGQ